MRRRIGLVWSSVFVLVVFLALFCVSCTKSGAPSCTDESVKKLALDLSKAELKTYLFRQNLLSYDIVGASFARTATHEQLTKLMSNPDNPYINVKKVTAEVDKQIADSNISLLNIRVNGKNDEIKKCECGADLGISNGKTLPITYTAQLIEDGKVYVAVSGLR